MQGAAKRRILEVFKRAATQQTGQNQPERRRGDFVHGLLWGALLLSACSLAGCNPSRVAWAEPPKGAANPPARAFAVDAGAPAAVASPVEPVKASLKPPKLPHSPRLVCGKDSDCAIVPARPCMCPVCGSAWHEVLNQRELQKLKAMWARQRCVRHVCPKCESHLLGTKAVCRAGQCTVE